MNYLPAFPQDRADRPEMQGLTKLEYACIHCGVPETGDPDLDAIIAKGNQQKAAKDGLSLRQINALNAITPIGGQ